MKRQTTCQERLVKGTRRERLDPRYGKGFVFLALDANSNPENREIHVYVS